MLELLFKLVAFEELFDIGLLQVALYNLWRLQIKNDYRGVASSAGESRMQNPWDASLKEEERFKLLVLSPTKLCKLSIF